MTELWGQSDYTPPPKSRRKVGAAIGGATEHENMRQGSEALRDAVLGLLTERDAIPAVQAKREAKFAEQLELHAQARAAIKSGWLKEQVRHKFGLSNTAYEQLAHQVRTGVQ